MNKLKDFILNTVDILPVEAAYIANQFHPFNPKKGDLLLAPGQVSDDYIFLQYGVLRTFAYDLEGDQITTDFFTSNNIAFEITSFFNREPSHIYLEAVTDCLGFRISYHELNTLFHDKPAFRDFGRAILVKEFIRSKKRIYSMITQTALERYQRLLDTQAEVIKSTPLKHIASFLGITDSSLSRIRRSIV